jgi:hypothetical protein
MRSWSEEAAFVTLFGSCSSFNKLPPPTDRIPPPPPVSGVLSTEMLRTAQACMHSCIECKNSVIDRNFGFLGGCARGGLQLCTHCGFDARICTCQTGKFACWGRHPHFANLGGGFLRDFVNRTTEFLPQNMRWV